MKPWCPKPNFRVDDLVLMADGNMPRGQWQKALVEKNFPDSEGIVRQEQQTEYTAETLESFFCWKRSC